VVVTFALVGENVVTAIDHKPKRTLDLQRLANIEANRMVSFLVDHYDPDWQGLWWVRVDGAASIHRSGEIWDRAVEALAAKYFQYAERPPEGPVIAISQDRVTGWASTEQPRPR
jgi:PPOX class probable F420-dependent enzyme